MFDPIDDQQKRDDEGIEKMLAAGYVLDPDDGHDECDHDDEYEERVRMVRHLSCYPEGLTSSEIADIMAGD